MAKSRQYAYIKCPYCKKEYKSNMVNWHVRNKCKENSTSEISKTYMVNRL